MGKHNVPAINSPLLQSSDTNLPSTLVERDSNGESRFGYAIGESGLQSEGSLWVDLDAKTSSYVATTTDFALTFDLSGGAATLSLPAASTSENQLLVVKLVSGSDNALTIDGNLTETIDGDTTISLVLKYESVVLHCDGSNWHVVHRYVPTISTTKSATYTVNGAANVYFNTEGSAYTINLPPAAAWKGKVLTFTKVDNAAFGAVLDGNSSENVDGASTKALGSTQFRVTRVISDGTQWYSA